MQYKNSMSHFYTSFSFCIPRTFVNIANSEVSSIQTGHTTSVQSAHFALTWFARFLITQCTPKTAIFEDLNKFLPSNGQKVVTSKIYFF